LFQNKQLLLPLQTWGKTMLSASKSAPIPMRKSLRLKLYRDRFLVLMVLLPIAYFLVFSYLPMFGLVMAFQRFSPGKGFFHSPFVGLRFFKEFFSSYYFSRIIRNTVYLSFGEIIFGFPLPIIFALMVNEIRKRWFAKIIQTISYFPHFVSVVIVCGLMYDLFSSDNGLVNQLIVALGGSKIAFYSRPEWFRPMYIGSSIWQNVGWNSIVYLAALSAIDQQMYEAAKIDGASRLKQLWYITLPSLLPTIMMLLILRIGQVMNVGFEKVLLMYSPAIYETSDVISTYVYRRGIIDSEYSFGSAVDLFNCTVNFLLVYSANFISKQLTGNSLW
jgi:putative aldouronate transport system permease protein